MRRQRLGGHLQVLEGDLSEESGARAGRTLLASEVRPTAIVAYNDRSAVGVLDALLRAGVAVPEVVSVVGYDDSPLARLAHIDLTTVSQESEQLMRHAVAAVVERLDGDRTEHREVVIAPRLVVRGTTGAPAMH
jgi:DNA-binding LacI/PurR family transcriptional regulator